MTHYYARHKPMPISFRDPKTGKVFTVRNAEDMERLEKGRPRGLTREAVEDVFRDMDKIDEILADANTPRKRTE